MSEVNTEDWQGEGHKIRLSVIAGVWSLDGKTSLKESKETNLVAPAPLIDQPRHDR